jgi:hypothetical protein
MQETKMEIEAISTGKLNGGGMGMESKTLRVGFLPLNDCRAIVIARELGLFEQSHRQRQRDAELQSAGLCCRHSQSTSAEPAVYEVLIPFVWPNMAGGHSQFYSHFDILTP